MSVSKTHRALSTVLQYMNLVHWHLMGGLLVTCFWFSGK